MKGESMSKVFVVEDDDNIREMIMYALSSAGFEVEGFSNGEVVFSALLNTIPALFLLDIMLPISDGLSILKELKQREKYKHIPVIMLTAKGNELDRIKGLDLGADDYITKPFSVMEVISRVKAVLRRCKDEAKQLNELKIGSIELNKAKRIVYIEKNEIVLTFKEFELLLYLMLNEGIVLSRDKLLEQVWGYNYEGESRTVDMHVKSLRQKLNTAKDQIKTVRGVGYKIGG